MRRIAYLGSAQRDDVQEDRAVSYGIGDIVPALPVACTNLKMPGMRVYLGWFGLAVSFSFSPLTHRPLTTVCRGLEFVKPTAEGIDQFTYTMAGGNVPFYASDMRNDKGWRRVEDFLFQARQLTDIPNGIYMAHLCT
jgi:hypothetical protein